MQNLSTKKLGKIQKRINISLNLSYGSGIIIQEKEQEVFL